MADPIATGASDPSADGALLAWHVPGQPGVIVNGDQRAPVGGSHPALGGGRIAVIDGDVIHVRQTAGEPFAATVAAPGADAVAVSAAWVAWRTHDGERDVIYAARLAGGQPKRVASGAQLGRPALERSKLAFHTLRRSGSRIVIADLERERLSTVRHERRALLLNPSLEGGRLLYVRAYYARQELRLGPQRRRSPRRDRRLWSTVPTARRDAGREPGERHKRHGHPKRLWARPPRGHSMTLWTTALASDAAYVTRLQQIAGAPLAAEILRVPR